jgi:polar amino acid transport system substrate-binding protein
MIYKQGQEYVGLEADCARALGKALDRPVEFVSLKWEDLIPALSKGKVDIIMSSMSITQGRTMQVDFARPYMKVGQMALVRGEDRGKYLLGFQPGMSNPVGVKAATTGDFLVRQEWPKAKRKSYRTGDDAAKALLKKKIDLFIADATLIWWLAGTHEAQGLVSLPFLLSNEQLAWAVRKGDDALLESVNEFQQQIQSDGRFESIMRRWLPQAPSGKKD